VSLYEDLHLNLVFMDVQMPKGDGFSLLPKLQPLPAIIFVTACDQFAVKAFEVDAVDYLLKPVRPERLAMPCSESSIRKSLHRQSGFPMTTRSFSIRTPKCASFSSLKSAALVRRGTIPALISLTDLLLLSGVQSRNGAACFRNHSLFGSNGR
jgi:DNA-binding LytR/AlgR family response regulator